MSTQQPIKRRFRFNLLLGVIVFGLLACLLGGVGYYFYKQKLQHDYQHAMVEAVRQGGIVIDDELHNWKIRSAEEPYEPVELELFVRNQSGYQVNGHLVFTGDMNTKRIEESYIESALRRFRKDGFQDEFLKSTAFAELGPKFRAIHNYIQRGEKLAPNLTYEPFEASSGIYADSYSFSFRQKVNLRSGEAARITYSHDMPIKFCGFLLKIRVNDIELSQ